MAESFYDQLASDGSYVNEVRVRRSRVMEKMPMRLFYLFIIQIVMDMISEFEMITDAVPWINPLAQIAAIVVVIAYGVTLLQYREYTKEYVWAFVGKIASVMYSAVTVIVYFLGISLEYNENETPVGVTLLLCVLGIVTVIGALKEFKGHAEVLSGIDDDIAGQWRKLWKVFLIGCGILLALCFFIGFIMEAQVLVAICTAIAGLGWLVYKLILFYNTSAAFSYYLRYYDKEK